MLKVYRGRIRVAFLMLSVMALIMCAIALIQVYAGPAKTDANAIMSPWNFSQAPPQGISRGCVRVIAEKKMLNPASPKFNAKARTFHSIRTASAASMLR